MLGINLPQDVKRYKSIKNIVSIDTSNPIVHGIKGIMYTEYGLTYKNPTLLANLMETVEIPWEVYYNIGKFREFAK